LDWTEPHRQPHLETLRLYRDFLRFRKANLTDRRRGRWQIEQVSPQAIAIRYQREKEGDILIVAQLVANDITLELENDLLAPTNGRTWDFIISTNEPIYGGKQAAQFDRDGKKLVLTEPELIVFCEKDEQNT
jgi:hypothetical protein